MAVAYGMFLLEISKYLYSTSKASIYASGLFSFQPQTTYYPL